MGLTSKRPPLPAPTESSVTANSIGNGHIEASTSDLGTDLSQRTDRTHYSIPDDGREIKVPTKKIRVGKPSADPHSQTSLLIEYFDSGKGNVTPDGRPSVRVRVTPGASKTNKASDVKVTQVGRDSRPTHTRRISLGGKKDTRKPPVSFSHTVEESNLSERSPIEVEVMGHQSELSELPPESNVSSLPPDSLLEAPAKIKEPERRRSRSLDRAEAQHVEEVADATKLAAPAVGRSRSLSKERITRKALEKIAREQSPDAIMEAPRKLHKSRPQSSGSELVEENMKTRSRRSSKSHRDSSDLRSATESSLMPPRDNESNLSGTSKVSLNNPKLIATVEDAIRRLILPEIETIKRNQSVRSTQTRDSYTTEGSSGRRLSKSTSEPHVKSRDRDDVRSRDGERRHRRHKKSSRDMESDVTSSRRDSLDSIAAEKERIRRSKDSRKRDTKTTEGSLTRANLKSHDSRSSVDTERKHRDKHKSHSKSKSRSNSIAETEDEYYRKEQIPPMPLASEIQDSELTRTSLLSAETAETDGVQSRSDRTAEQATQSTSRDISAASPATSKTPRGSRSKDSLGLRSAKSDKSMSSKQKAAALAAAGLGGAAGGLYGLKGTRETSRPSSRKSSAEKRVASGEHSPAVTGNRSTKDTVANEAKVSQLPRELAPPERPANIREISKESIKSAPTQDYPVTSKRHIVDKRHETLNYEDPELLGDEAEEQAELRDEAFEEEGDSEEFFERQHKLNNQYRTSFDEETQRDSAEWSKSFGPRDSIDTGGSLGNVTTAQAIRGISAKPQIVHEPHHPESAVASLINQSMVSEQSQASSVPEKPVELHHKVDVDDLEETREVHEQEEHLEQQPKDVSPWLTEHNNTSAERWNAIRDHVEKMSSGANSVSTSGSPVKRNLHGKAPAEPIVLGASAVPAADDDMPEIGYGHDAESELTDHGSMKRPDSIIEGPLGDEYEAKGLWPYEPTPDLERRGGFIHPSDRDSRSIDSGVAAAIGAAGAAGLGIGAAEAARSGKVSQPSLRQERSMSAPSDDGRYQMQPEMRQPQMDQRYLGPSPNAHKDEGYISAAQPRSPSNASPLSFSKPPPKLFDDRDVQKYPPTTMAAATAAGTTATPEDPFLNEKSRRHLSMNSHGMPSDAYDAATGTGINNIQSKDVVALMDHLTVRDAHRNARDTEILVTLVRSAAEMRNNFDELKNVVDMQGQLNRRHNTGDANAIVSKILNGTRAAALSSNAPSRSTRFTSASSEKDLGEPPKKKNIFKRALSGLGSRNEKDLSKIEDMLMQLLEDVESLKDVQASSIAAGSQQQILPTKASLDSYERLRAGPESGYEPEGQAGTSSTPNVSGTFSPTRQAAQRMHSGYNINRDSGKISTVLEHPEEYAQNDTYENDDGMLTPTQEAQNQRSGLGGAGSQYETPPSGGRSRGMSGGNVQFTPNTPRTNDTKGRQKSTSSSVFGGVPRISRWSKTTTSSAPGGRDSFQYDRPYSEASRSGSDVNVLGGADGSAPYEGQGDGRMRSAHSLTREQLAGRSPSPLLPQDAAPLDDPKHRANRHSLTLEHPQPRHGSMKRHQNQLENQAYDYHGDEKRVSSGGQSYASAGDRAYVNTDAPRAHIENSPERGSPVSPNADVFGSAPTLNKRGFSQRSSRSVSGEYGTPGSTGSGGYRAPQATAQPGAAKVRDDGPLVPQSGAVTATRQATRDNTRRDSLDSLSDDSYGESLSATSYRRREQPANGADDRSFDEESYTPSEEGESIPDNVRQQDWNSRNAAPEPEEDDESYFPRPIPLERPRSPYYPGAQLTTIEERYSLEQSRVSSPLSRHQSVRSRRDDAGSSRINEEDEDDDTPTGSPTKTGTVDSSPVTPGSGQRKVTPLGPRAMPGVQRRRVS